MNLFQENVCPSTLVVLDDVTHLRFRRTWWDIHGVTSLNNVFLRFCVFFITVLNNVSIFQGVKCSVMWGVGCGKSSYYCWRGNVCLPKSVPCNGFCTKYYRMDEYSVCQFDPELVLSPERDKREPLKKTAGTIAPIVTISLLILFTAIVVFLWMFRHKLGKFCSNKKSKTPAEMEKQPSLSELEMMELTDPFMSRCQNVKTFSVLDRDGS